MALLTTAARHYNSTISSTKSKVGMAAKTSSSSGRKSNCIVGATLTDDPNMLVGLPDEGRASVRGTLASHPLFLP